MSETWIRRLFWFKERLYDSRDPEDDGKMPVPTREKGANLVGSLTKRGLHAPVIDIDYEARLVPSSTKGHYHLYLDKETTWPKYKAVLAALADAGLIQKGYYDWSVERGMSFLRKPDVRKDEPAPQA